METRDLLREGNNLLNISQGTDLIDGRTLVSVRWKTIDKMKFILRVLRQIIKERQCELFELIEDEGGQVRAGLCKGLAKTLLNAMKIDHSDIVDYEVTHNFHPFLDLFISLCRKYNIFTDIPWDLLKLRGRGAIQAVSDLNLVVRELREVSTAEDFKKRVRNFERRSRENYIQLVKYIDAIFSVRARILVLRLDLWYNEGYLKNHAENPEPVYRRIKRDWKSFHRYMTREVFPESLMGFVWRLEYGVYRSYHLHTLILLDGSKHQKDIIIAKILGDFWKENITSNDGDYFNCNAGKYFNRAIGEIHRSNTQARDSLKNIVCNYLTKPDLILPLKTPDGGRSFGKGKMP